MKRGEESSSRFSFKMNYAHGPLFFPPIAESKENPFKSIIREMVSFLEVTKPLVPSRSHS